MKAKDLRTKNTDELKQELFSLLKEQFNLKTQKGVGQSPKTHLLHNVRKNIALVKTILSEKGLLV